MIGNLTDRLFSDLHGYCLLKQKALLISCGNCALIFENNINEAKNRGNE